MSEIQNNNHGGYVTVKAVTTTSRQIHENSYHLLGAISFLNVLYSILYKISHYTEQTSILSVTQCEIMHLCNTFIMHADMPF